MRFLPTSPLTVLAFGTVVACRSSEADRPSPTPSVPSSVASAMPASSVKNELARIVFVDKEKCCQCTRDRIEASWSALQAALAGRRDAVRVERVHFDTQPQLARRYHARRPIMAFPAVYFLDDEGNVLELLQGELTREQLSAALEGQ